jgi:hypothetical protein
MAIQPIDLQTLFTQLDKVGKAQSAQREGLAVHQAMQGVQMQRKTDEQIQSVNEAQNTGDGAEKVQDRRKGEKETSGGKGKKKEGSGKDDTPDEKRPYVFHDPRLGRNIDISL